MKKKIKSKKNPITQEIIERWRQGKVNVFDEMARLEDRMNEYKNLADTLQGYLNNIHKNLKRFYGS
jgi:uncharacterized protein YbgA (DUF1722 family)